MRYAECLAFLESLGHELRGRKFDLSAITTILAALGHPERRYRSALVAGTNGKGSTAAMLASVLWQAGYRAGLYTSPHLVRVNERIRVQDRDITDGDFARDFTAVRVCAGRLIAEGALPQEPSFFEYLTAISFLHFARAQVEFAVFEVGMGGRLDATNVIFPEVAVITNVSLDHQEFLGDTVRAIATEKAGIIKPGIPVVSTCEDADAAQVIRERCMALSSELMEMNRIARASEEGDEGGFRHFRLHLEGEDAGRIALPLAGRFQTRNALAAATAAWVLNRRGISITKDAIVLGIARARWPGRLETVGSDPLVVLDGGHNVDAAAEIAEFARAQWRGRRLRLLYASMRDKDIRAITRLLFPLADEVYLTHPRVARAATPEQILAATAIVPQNLLIEEDPAQALEKALGASAPDDVILAAGSLYLVGAIKQTLIGRPLPLAFRRSENALASAS